MCWRRVTIVSEHSIDPMQTLWTPLGTAAEAIGRADFYARLLAALRRWLQADLAMVMRYSERAAPEYLIDEGLDAAHMQLYLGGLYRVDPIYQLCRQGPGRGVKDLQELATPAQRTSQYFSIFLQVTGMADDLALLFPATGGSTIGLVYERGTAFEEGEIALLKTMFPLFDGLHRAHQRLRPAADEPAAPETVRNRVTKDSESAAAGLPPIEYRRALQSFLQGQLTPRERDIMSLIFAGYPNSKIAQRLRLSINTVKNHKKRMYLKLDITTERELFMNFVTFLLHGN